MHIPQRSISCVAEVYAADMYYYAGYCSLPGQHIQTVLFLSVAEESVLLFLSLHTSPILITLSSPPFVELSGWEKNEDWGEN